MRSVSTREFLAGVAIAQQFALPAHSPGPGLDRDLFGHVKGEWSHLEKIRDPGELEIEFDRRRLEHNTVRLHASVGYVIPETNTPAAARVFAKPAATG